MTVNDKHVTLGGLESSVSRAVSESKAYTDEQLNAEGIEAALAQISGDISGLGDKIKNITVTGAQASDALPLAAADEASAGTSNEFSRADHVHPKVDNTDNLGGQPASYYASNETVNNIIDGTTVVKKAETATLAETATKAESADNATMLGGVPATNYAQTVVVEKIIQGETDVANSAHADTATKLDTARAIVLSGDVSGSTTFDGTTNVDIEVEIADDSHNHVISNVDGLQEALDAKATNDALTALSTKVNAILSADGVVEKANKLSTARTVSISGDVTGSTTFDGSANVDIKATVVGGVPLAGETAPKVAGTAAVGTSAKYAREDHVHPVQTSVSGNAGTATKLAAARTIALTGDVTGTATAFDGTTNISIPATIANMKAATADAAGTKGLVPAPAAGSQGKYLRGDGTWQTPTNTTYSNATTSAAGLMSSTDKSKLDGIAASANNYTHPTSAGNKHIPSGGSSGQILRWSADGTAAWGADNNTTYAVFKAATADAAGGTGLVPAPAAGAQGKFLRGDGTWQTPTNTTYSNFVKSGSGAKAGLVPAPSTTAGTTKYLREDGTWQTPPDTNTTYTAASATPKAAGTAAVGTSAKYAREDHVHPAQTSVSGNAGSATKLATARNIGSASFNGTANITLAQMGVESFVNSRHGTITLATSDTWTADGSNYYVTKTISGLLATDRIDIATDYATLITLDNPIMAVNVNGVCRIYCKAKPSKAITLQYTLIRQAA